MSLQQINVNNSQVTGVDDEPTVGSDNLVKSNGIVKSLKNIEPSLVLNKFNKDGSNVALYKYLDYNNGITLLDFDTWNTTDFIEVNPNKLYDMVSFRDGVKGNIVNGHIYGYDENKNFINIADSVDFGTTQNKTLAEFLQFKPIPSNVKYVRFSFYNTDWDYCIFAEKHIIDTINAYVSFGTTLFDIIKLQNENAINYDGIVKSINRIADGVPYPIQTLVAYKYVVKKFGYKILLCDLLFTSDNVPVLSHDFYLNQYYNNVRMADGSAIPDPSIETNRVYINQTSYQTLYDNYDFGVYIGSQFAGIKLQKFEDFVKMCRNLGVSIYVEIKQMTVAQAQIATSIVQKYGMVDKTSWTAGIGQTTLMQEIVRLLPMARVSYMPPDITNHYIDMAAALKNGQNEVFLFGWDSTNLTDALVSYMVEKDVAFEIGTLNTKQAILSYFDRSDAQKYCTGIETQTIIAGKVLYENELNVN